MGFLTKILGKGGKPDPTADWPAPSGPMPLVLPFRGRFGDLNFGDSIDAARGLGKPNRFRTTQPEYCELLYADAGFQLDFDEGAFAYLALLIDHHGAEPDVEFQFAEPEVMLADGSIVTFSRESNRTDIEGHLGTPTEIDEDPDEIVLKYETGALTMEFELHPTRGTLARWNLFP